VRDRCIDNGELSLEQGITLIVGLGNPGPQYENTRHNAGFWLVRLLSDKHQGFFKQESKFKGLVSNVEIEKQKCILLLPQTFMNLSGEAVSQIVNFYKLSVDSLLVVHDELDFPPGVVRLKKGGGANGHNGVENIINRLGTDSFWRLRIGIGKAEYRDNTTSYVISSPSQPEFLIINEAIDQAISYIPKLVLGDFQGVMSQLHKTLE
jgi:peptidyl-tRNA hydrolase, PTH1 family